MHYLTTRSKKVKYNQDVSSSLAQGSILGLTLFVICINDLSQSLMKSSIGMYADDTIINFFDANAEIIKWFLQNNVKKMLSSQWLIGLLCLNTVYISFHQPDL